MVTISKTASSYSICQNTATTAINTIAAANTTTTTTAIKTNIVGDYYLPKPHLN